MKLYLSMEKLCDACDAIYRNGRECKLLGTVFSKCTICGTRIGDGVRVAYHVYNPISYCRVPTPRGLVTSWEARNSH